MSPFALRREQRSDNPNAAMGVTGRAMPAIRIMSPSSVRYYKLHFLDDGFPAQRRSNGTFYEHPLYPIYIAEEYLRQNARRPDAALVEAAKLVVDAALRRAEPFGDALVFWYGSDANVTRAAHRHYSALTQAYYVGVLASLHEVMGRRHGYHKIAQQFARSLVIPASEGGVMQVRREGKGIEELPLDMPDLVLNGWLSALAKLSAYPKILRRAELGDFMDDNLDLLEHLLPRYDLPALENSRYSLSGYSYVRLSWTGGARVRFGEACCSWSADEKYPLGTGDDYRWRNFFLSGDVANVPGGFASRGRSVRANLVLSQLAEENALEFVASADRRCSLAAEMMVGEFDPFTTTPAATRWKPLATVAVGPEPALVRIPIPPAFLSLIGYPTNFQKSFDGKNRNVYHPIHVKGLYQLHRYQARPIFIDYARRWAGYIGHWPRNPHYARFGAGEYGDKIPRALRGQLASAGA